MDTAGIYIIGFFLKKNYYNRAAIGSVIGRVISIYMLVQRPSADTGNQ